MTRRIRRTLAAAAALAALLPISAAHARPDVPSAFVYVTANGGASVFGYAANGAGQLAPLSPPSAAVVAKPVGVALSPDEHSLYVANQADHSVSQFDVAGDGALTPKSPAAVRAGGSPFGLALSADGHSLYVANQADDTVSQFDVAGDGTLTPKSRATVATGDGPVAIAVAPAGGVYVTNLVDGTVSQYAAAADGALSALSPARVAAGSSPVAIAVAPDGNSLYVVHQLDDGGVSQFSINAGGGLTALSPARVSAGRLPAGLALSPDGANLYVANFGDDTISQYDVAGDGTLSAKPDPTVSTAKSPFGLAVAPDGQSLYAANFGAGTVSQYDLKPTGALSPKDRATVASGPAPVGVAVRRGPDATAPTVTLDTPPDGARYALDEEVLAEYACADDGGSGLASCTGDVPDGEPIDTATPGEKTFTVVARDRAGHETTVTHHYEVVAGPEEEQGGSFVRPIVALPAVNEARAGRVVVIRFRLEGDHRLDVLAEGYPKTQVVPCDSTEAVDGAEPARSFRDRGLRFRRHARVFQFAWVTERAWAGTCRQFVLKFNEGGALRAQFEFWGRWSWWLGHRDHDSD